MKEKKLEMLQTEAKTELLEHILPFWENLKDEENGGFYGFVDQDLQVDKTYEKGCILNSRILWFFSEAYLTLGDSKLLECAGWAWNFLERAFVDREEGGLYWSVTFDGKPLDQTKHTYNQAFAIYGLCSYYRATGEEKARERALALYRLIEEKMRDEKGYLEAFNRDFTPASNEKLSENGVFATRTMNTILHVMEAYTSLGEITEEDGVRERLREILGIITHKIYNQKLHRQEVFFDADYHSLIDLYSYGHDIEAAWLIDEAAKVAYPKMTVEEDRELYAISEMTRQMEEAVYQEAYDGHSIPNESENGVVKENRVWWIQAEAVNGFVNAWEKQPQKEEYLEAAWNIWQYTKEYLIDHRKGGEWFWEVDKEGRPIPERGVAEPWKCPYHNGRMCLLLIRRRNHAA